MFPDKLRGKIMYYFLFKVQTHNNMGSQAIRNERNIYQEKTVLVLLQN